MPVVSGKFRGLKAPFSPCEARMNGKNGAIASAISRRKKKEIRERLLPILDNHFPDGMTGAEKIAAALFEQAIKGNVRAFAEIRDTVYGKPVSVVDMKSSDGSMSPKDITIDITQVSDDPVEAARIYQEIMG